MNEETKVQAARMAADITAALIGETQKGRLTDLLTAAQVKAGKNAVLDAFDIVYAHILKRLSEPVRSQS
jgi:hypothetical protein